MRKYIVIIVVCAFIIANEFEDVAAQDGYDYDRGFVERFEFVLLGNTLFA